MHRKDFLKNIGVGVGSLILLETPERAAAQEPAPAAPKKPDPREKMTQDWIVSLLKHMDSTLSEDERVKIMEHCGRDCAKRGAISLARQNQGNVDGLLAKLATHVGPENARREGNTVFLGYDKCFCPLVASGPERLSDTYCNCSRGWVREMLETASGAPVEVELKQSIKRGAPSCRFVATLAV